MPYGYMFTHGCHIVMFVTLSNNLPRLPGYLLCAYMHTVRSLTKKNVKNHMVAI